MSHGAKDVAQYIVNYFIEAKAPITNLQLQKLLYFSWIDYFIKKGEHLFNDLFVAWPLGPVVPVAYYDFCAYGADMIFRFRDVQLSGIGICILDNCLKSFKGISAYSLVERSHRPGGAWDRVYRNGKGRGEPISFESIKTLECRV